MTITADGDRSRPRLTLWRLTKAQLRAFLGGPLVGWGIVAVLLAAVVSGVIAGLSGLSGHRVIDPVSVVNTAILFAAAAVQLFAIVVGSEAIAGEFAVGTIGATLSISPRRGQLFSAKTLAICGSVMLLAGLAGLLAGGSTLLIAAIIGRQIDTLTVFAWLASTGGLALGSGIVALIALGLGALTRQRIIAVLTPIAALYILPILAGLLPDGIARDWINSALPGTALTALATAHVHDGILSLWSPLSGTASGTLWGALLVLGAWSALVVPWSLITFIRRDLSATSSGRGRSPSRAAVKDRRPRPPFRSTPGGLFRSELRKSWSLPAVRWIIASAILLEIGYGVARATWNSIEGVGANLSDSLSIEYSYAITDGVGGVALILAVLAAIQVAGEFETGTAIATFIAAPRRWQVTVSKALVAALSGLAIGLPALVLTGLVIIPIYTARGYILTNDVLFAGGSALARAILFLLLTTLMSAGIAGAMRRSVVTVITVSVLLVIGPSLLNVILGFARMAQSPLVAIGNAARFLPSEGERFFVPYGGPSSFASLDGIGVLQVSVQFGIVVTAVWAIAFVAAWFATDIRRPISTR